MTLQERLEILEMELKRQLEYKALVTKIDSTIDYSSEDFERESMLQIKIRETRKWINGKH